MKLVANTTACCPLPTVPLNTYYLDKGLIMNVPKTPDHKLIGALRILANDAMRGAVDLNVLPAVLYEVADRLAEITQPQPIETAPEDTKVIVFGLCDDGHTPYNDYGVNVQGTWYHPDNISEGEHYDAQPTHWLPCLVVDYASLGGQANGK
jgi:hypothetical protein